MFVTFVTFVTLKKEPKGIFFSQFCFMTRKSLFPPKKTDFYLEKILELYYNLFEGGVMSGKYMYFSPTQTCIFLGTLCQSEIFHILEI
jgi:hypothetical protein